MRLERKGAVAPGNAAAGRVHHEFEETAMAAASRGGGDKDGGKREGELADVRRRS